MASALVAAHPDTKHAPQISAVCGNEHSGRKMRLDLIWQIARKELLLFFASPIAYLVLGAFRQITLFVFFWGSAFFAANIADVRPMF